MHSPSGAGKTIEKTIESMIFMYFVAITIVNSMDVFQILRIEMP